MKTKYYLIKFYNGHTKEEHLLDLVSDDGINLKFQIKAYDWDSEKDRVITLRATRRTKIGYYGQKYTTIEFESSKLQFKNCCIVEK